MNANDSQQVRQEVTRHLTWLRKKLPNVYNGLVETLVATPANNARSLGFHLNSIFDEQLAAQVPVETFAPTMDYSSVSDSSGGSLFSGLIDSVSNLLSSGGVQSLIKVATPFVNNAVQKQALSTQLTQLRSGLPVTIAGTTTPMQTQPLSVSASGAVSSLTRYMPYILIGGGAYLLLKLLKR